MTFLNSYKYLFIASLFFVFSFADILAQNWTGNVNSDWNNPSNWTGWPLNGDDILIDPVNYSGAAASPVITSNSVFTPDGVVIQNGALVVINANLTANSRVELIGTGTQVTINSGTVHAAGGGSDGRFIVSDGATVTMNGGLLQANQRIIVELGGIFTLHNGTVNPLQELAIGDGNLSGSSLFDMDGGSVIVGQAMGFENESGTFYPTFQMSAGTLTINGDLTWFGETPGGGTPRFIMTGGNANIQGNILNDPASTVELYIRLSGTAALNFSGASIDLAHSTDSIIQLGSSVMMLNNTNTWNNAGVMYASNASTVFNGNTILQGNGDYKFHSVMINSTRTLTHSSPGTISVNGNFTNDGAFNSGLNTVVFGGAVPQTISGSSISGFNNLTLNNSSGAGLTLLRDIIISGVLQLSNGKMNSSTAHMVTLIDNASSSGGSAVSFVNGPMKKTGNDAFIFPIGKNNRWRRLAITSPVSVASEFTAEYFDQSYSDIMPVNPPLNAVTNIEYWMLNRANSTDNVQVSLFWEDAAASAITDCGELTMAYWSGAAWNEVPSVTSGLCTGNDNGLIQSNSAVGNFGAFTFGFFGNVTAQNITICFGDSLQVGTNIYTASGNYIDVLTAADLSDSTVLTQLQVLPQNIVNQQGLVCFGETYTVGSNVYSMSGEYIDTLVSAFGCDSIIHTSLTVLEAINVSVLQDGAQLMADESNADAYQWVDCNTGFASLPGENGQSFTATVNGLYAVVIEVNGCSDTSDCYAVVSVSVPGNGPETFLQVYPNPGDGMIMIQYPAKESAFIQLVDASGRILEKRFATAFPYEMDLTSLPSGIYFLEVIDSNNPSRVKLIRK